jgi:hypothetical protein
VRQVVAFEERAGLFKGEETAVDFKLVVTGVVWDVDDVANGVAVLTESLDDKTGVNHGQHCTFADGMLARIFAWPHLQGLWQTPHPP